MTKNNTTTIQRNWGYLYHNGDIDSWSYSTGEDTIPKRYDSLDDLVEAEAPLWFDIEMRKEELHKVLTVLKKRTQTPCQT